jgi:hypothetical protein
MVLPIKPPAPPVSGPTQPEVIGVDGIRAGVLNSYNNLTNHIVLSQGYYDNLMDVSAELARRNTEPDQLTGMNGPFKAIALRVEAPSKSIFDALMPSANAPKLLSIKARIPEFHQSLPMPTAADMEAERSTRGTSNTKVANTVDFYPTFLAQDDSTIEPKVGDVVWVTFSNVEQMTGGTYLGPVTGAGLPGMESCKQPDGKVDLKQCISNMAKAAAGEVVGQGGGRIEGLVGNIPTGSNASKLFNQGTSNSEQFWYQIKSYIDSNYTKGDTEVLSFIKNKVSNLGMTEKRIMAVRSVCYYTVMLNIPHVRNASGYDCVGTMVRNYYQTKYVMGDLEPLYDSVGNMLPIKYFDLQWGGSKQVKRPFVPFFIDVTTGMIKKGKLYEMLDMRELGAFHDGILKSSEALLKQRMLEPVNAFDRLQPGDGLFMLEKRHEAYINNVNGHVRTVVDIDRPNQILLFMEGRTGMTPIFNLYYYGNDSRKYSQILKNGGYADNVSGGLKYISLPKSSAYFKMWLATVEWATTKSPIYYPYVYIIPFDKSDWRKDYRK